MNPAHTPLTWMPITSSCSKALPSSKSGTVSLLGLLHFETLHPLPEGAMIDSPVAKALTSPTPSVKELTGLSWEYHGCPRLPKPDSKDEPGWFDCQILTATFSETEW
jgi:hypothetical protein